MSIGVKIRSHTIDGKIKIPSSGVLLDIWEAGGLVDLKNALDGPLTITCASDDDKLGGLGAHKLKISANTSGASPRFDSQTFNLNGLTPVVTGDSFQAHSLAQARVTFSDDLFRTDLPVGDITITQPGALGPVVVGKILAAGTQTHHSFRRIPFGSGGEVERWVLSGGYLTLVDLAGKPDANVTLPLYKKAPGDQIHTDGEAAMQAALSPQAPFLFQESFESGEDFLLRINSDQTLVEFFVNMFVRVYVERDIAPVLADQDIIQW